MQNGANQRVGKLYSIYCNVPFSYPRMLESLHMKFQAKIYRSDRIRIYSPRHHDNRSGSQDTPYIPCQF